jgi:hypothetical protein
VSLVWEEIDAYVGRPDDKVFSPENCDLCTEFYIETRVQGVSFMARVIMPHEDLKEDRFYQNLLNELVRKLDDYISNYFKE